jgi:hypothetical protein
MKYNIIILLSFFILSGCSSLEIFKKKENLIFEKNKNSIFYEKYSAKGVVKFEVKDKKIASRFIFYNNANSKELNFLNMFNSKIISLEINNNEINVINVKKDKNAKALEKIMNRDTFKKIILNLSGILTGDIGNIVHSERYKSGLYKILRNPDFEVFYKKYDNNLMPTNMIIDLFNISFEIKIAEWKLIK